MAPSLRFRGRLNAHRFNEYVRVLHVFQLTKIALIGNRKVFIRGELKDHDGYCRFASTISSHNMVRSLSKCSTVTWGEIAHICPTGVLPILSGKMRVGSELLQIHSTESAIF